MNDAEDYLKTIGVPNSTIRGRKPKGQMPEYSSSLSELLDGYYQSKVGTQDITKEEFIQSKMDRINNPWEAVDRISKAREVISELYDEYIDKAVNNIEITDSDSLHSVRNDWDFIEWIDKGMWCKHESTGSNELVRQDLWYNTYRYSAMEKPLTNDELYKLYKST